MQIFKVRVIVSYLSQNFENLQRYSRENHGHGGREHGVRRGVFGGKHSFKKMSAGGRLCTSQENPRFWVPTIEVRQPSGMLKLEVMHSLTFFP